MWIYSQSTGAFCRADGSVLDHGYSGAGAGKNNPAKQNVHDVGPIPQGLWAIGYAHDVPHLGPIVMTLTAAPGTQTFGRSGFLIHADAPARPGTASHGCIILPAFARAAIAASRDKELEVTV